MRRRRNNRRVSRTRKARAFLFDSPSAPGAFSERRARLFSRISAGSGGERRPFGPAGGRPFLPYAASAFPPLFKGREREGFPAISSRRSQNPQRRSLFTCQKPWGPVFRRALRVKRPTPENPPVHRAKSRMYSLRRFRARRAALFRYLTLMRPKGLELFFDTLSGEPEISILPIPAISASTLSDA